MDMISKNFILAGDAIFTIEPTAAFCLSNRCSEHYTFRVQHVEASDRWPESYFVKLLTGPDNTRDYSYVGKLGADCGEVWLSAKSRVTDDSISVRILRRVLAAIFAGRGDAVEAAGWSVHHEGRCGCCGRRLTTPESVESGIGPVCAAR